MNSLEILKEIISDIIVVNLKEISLETCLKKDLGCDSLDMVEITIAIEEKLDIKFSIPYDKSEIPKVQTVSDILELIERTINDINK